jgi:hypothetical protein
MYGQSQNRLLNIIGMRLKAATPPMVYPAQEPFPRLRDDLRILIVFV